METGYKVHEVMSKKVITANHGTSISDVAKIMTEKKVGSVVVVEDDKSVGIITEQDIARKVVAEGKDVNNTKVNEVMEKDLIFTLSSRDLYDAVLLMGKTEIKHLPVIDNGQLVGIITAKDIIRIKPYLIEMLTFKSSMSEDEAKKLFKGM
jgi:signal-transduction protein with cAMP-binding, CBS, and nucleotidyltransferase domain